MKDHLLKARANMEVREVDQLSRIPALNTSFRTSRAMINSKSATYGVDVPNPHIFVITVGVWDVITISVRTSYGAKLCVSSVKSNLQLRNFSNKQTGLSGTENRDPEAGNAMEMPEEVKMYHLLVLLLRLRQICCHPRLIKSMLESDEDDLQGEDGEEGDIVYPRILSFSNKVFDDDYVSSKVSIVVEELSRLKKEQDETGFVSQRTTLLDLVKIHVEEIGMSYSEIKGKIPIKERGNIVEEFNKNPCKPEVMFLSLAVGGVGLNLVGANHLFLLDMHWNPQQEAQACDRIYRVGQIREVKIHKFLVEDSIEERVLLFSELDH